jgi:hypothetical protein
VIGLIVSLAPMCRSSMKTTAGCAINAQLYDDRTAGVGASRHGAK